MTEQYIDQAILRFVQILRELAPYRTGNLALNGIRYEKLGKGRYKIHVDLKIAPYQVYVNERATYQSGKKNPNYKWWEAALELAFDELAKMLGGTIEK